MIFGSFWVELMLYRCVRGLICYIFWNNSPYNREKIQ